MIKTLKVLAAVAVAALALMVAGCAAPAGADGATGPQGPAGSDNVTVPANNNYTILGGVQAFTTVSSKQLNLRVAGDLGNLGFHPWTNDSLAGDSEQQSFKSQVTASGTGVVQVRNINLARGTSVAWNQLFSGIYTSGLYKVTASMKILTTGLATDTLEFQVAPSNPAAYGEWDSQDFAGRGINTITLGATADTAFVNRVAYANGFGSNSNLWVGLFASKAINYDIDSITIAPATSDADIVAAAVANFKSKFTYAASGGTTVSGVKDNFQVPETLYGATLTYSESVANLGIFDGGTPAEDTYITVTRPTPGNVDVTQDFTVAITKGSVTTNVTVPVTVLVRVEYTPVAIGASIIQDYDAATDLSFISQFGFDLGAAIVEGGGSPVTFAASDTGLLVTLKRVKSPVEVAWNGFVINTPKELPAGTYDVEVTFTAGSNFAAIQIGGTISQFGAIGANLSSAITPASTTATKADVAVSGGYILIGKNNDPAGTTDLTTAAAVIEISSIKFTRKS